MMTRPAMPTRICPPGQSSTPPVALSGLARAAAPDPIRIDTAVTQSIA